MPLMNPANKAQASTTTQRNDDDDGDDDDGDKIKTTQKYLKEND